MGIAIVGLEVGQPDDSRCTASMHPDAGYFEHGSPTMTGLLLDLQISCRLHGALVLVFHVAVAQFM